MNRSIATLTACVALSLVLPCLDAAAAEKKADQKPTKKPATQSEHPDTHSIQMIEGWRVIVDKRLTEGDSQELGKQALRVLANKLYEIAMTVPADRVADLRTVTIWMDAEHPLTSLQYHPGADWLRRFKYDARLVKCVHIPRADRLVRLVKSNSQPWVMLHELAHAYHDQFLSFDNKQVIEAYNAAVKSKRYESVLHINGHKTKHYALSNHKEYFAEMSESYFGTNDFYPFVRGELKQSDPTTYALMESIWRGKGVSKDSTKRRRNERGS